MTIPVVPIEEIKDPDALRVGQSKETRIYYRNPKDSGGNSVTDENGEKIWIPTTPLPADAWHMNHYAKKGFKLWPPEKEEKREAAQSTTLTASLNAISCPVEGCVFIAKTYIGLSRHMNRIHNTK